jgi:hypothetical protein
LKSLDEAAASWLPYIATPHPLIVAREGAFLIGRKLGNFSRRLAGSSDVSWSIQVASNAGIFFERCDLVMCDAAAEEEIGPHNPYTRAYCFSFAWLPDAAWKRNWKIF